MKMVMKKRVYKTSSSFFILFYMRYFTIKEFTKSETASRLGIDNTPSEEIKNHITLFVETVLDPIRQDWGGPILVSSGYRCPELNKAVSGAKNSGHQYGFCADLQLSDSTRLSEFADFVFNWMVQHQMKFDELLFERSGNVVWLHFCWIGKDGKQRMKRFDIVK